MSVQVVVPPLNAVDDAALVISAQRGDIQAKEALFRKYGLMVTGLCFRLLGRDSDLDDLAQECFVQMFRSLGRLDNPHAFRGWLGEIVVRTAHKHIRRRRVMARLGLHHTNPVNVDALISPDAPPDVVSKLKSVYRIVDRLPPRIQIALVLRRVEGRPLGEVAQLMGASVASVKRWVAVADEQLNAERSEMRGSR